MFVHDASGAWPCLQHWLTAKVLKRRPMINRHGVRLRLLIVVRNHSRFFQWLDDDELDDLPERMICNRSNNHVYIPKAFKGLAQVKCFPKMCLLCGHMSYFITRCLYVTLLCPRLPHLPCMLHTRQGLESQLRSTNKMPPFWQLLRFMPSSVVFMRDSKVIPSSILLAPLANLIQATSPNNLSKSPKQ